MKKIYFSLILCLLASFASKAQDPSKIAGLYYSDAGCGSGGNTYTFMPKGLLLVECTGCEGTSIKAGTWRLNGDKLEYTLTQHWYTEGYGEYIASASVGIWSKYKPMYRKILDTGTFSYEKIRTLFERSTDNDGCEMVQDHSETVCDPHVLLRNTMKSKYFFASERLLTKADLASYSKADLRIIRNEIFARYGYEFKSADLKAYFSKITGYAGIYENVDAFLSEIELKNIELIKSLE